MDKVKLSDFGRQDQESPIYLDVGGTTIEIKKRINYGEILAGIQWCVDYIIDDRPFVSAPLSEIITDVCIVKMFTNVDISDLELVGFTADNLYEMYDILTEMDVIETIKQQVNPTQLKFFKTTLAKTLENLVAYKNSALGVLDAITTAKKNHEEEVKTIEDILNNPEEFGQIQRFMKLFESPAPREG